MAMMLNPESEYFKSHVRKPSSYFRRIKHTDPKETEKYISKFFTTIGGYFVGIRAQEIFDTHDKNVAAFYVVKGVRK